MTLAALVVLTLVGDFETEVYARAGAHAIGDYTGATVADAAYPGGFAAGLGIGLRYLQPTTLRPSERTLVLGVDFDADETFGHLNATMFNTALLFGHWWDHVRFEAGPLLTIAWNAYYDKRLGYDASHDVWSTTSVGARAQLLYRLGETYSLGVSVDAGLAAMPHAEGTVRFGVRL